MTLQQLRCIQAVIDRKLSVSGAAEALHTTQPARGLVDAAVLRHRQQDAQLLQLHRGADLPESCALGLVPMASGACL